MIEDLRIMSSNRTNKERNEKITRNTYKPPYLSHTLPEQSFRDAWWLLDVETSSVSPERGEIIALRLALMENYEASQEQTIFVRPCQNLSLGIQRLTGITNEDLYRALPHHVAVHRLKALTRQAPLIFWNGGFCLPFLCKLFQTGYSEFDVPHLLLDGLGEQLLGDNLDKSPRRTLDGIDITCNSSLQNHYLAELHTLSALLFQRLEEQGLYTTTDLLTLSKEEMD